MGYVEKGSAGVIVADPDPIYKYMCIYCDKGVLKGLAGFVAADPETMCFYCFYIVILITIY